MLDIIIVNYNSTDLLLDCLASIEANLAGVDITIYVQDNASTDRVERVVQQFPHTVLTENNQNLGFAKAINQALSRSTGKYVILLNPDTCLLDGFLVDCIRFMDAHPDVGIMGPKILERDGKLQNSARAFPTPLTAFFGRNSFLSKRFPSNPITSRNLLSLQSDGKSPMHVDWVSGACMVVRREAIEDTGLLDERFFMYWEDADWCRRMSDAGWKVVYYPRVSIYHYVGGSSEKNVVGSVIEFHKSVYRLFDKYLGSTLYFLKPLVLGGLTIRLLFVLISQLLRRALHRLKDKPNRRNLQKKKTKAGGIKNPSKPWRNTPLKTHCTWFQAVLPWHDIHKHRRDKSVDKPKRIKVLRMISRLNIGGPSIHVHLLTNGLDPESFDTILVTGKISPQEGDMSYLFKKNHKKPMIIPDLQREISIFLDIRAIWKIFCILLREQPDIIHTHTAKAGFSARFAGFTYNCISQRRVRMLHTFHGNVFDGYFSRTYSILFIMIERLLAKFTDVIVAISESQKNELVHRYQIAECKKVKTIGLGFDLSAFLDNGQLKGQLRKKLGIDRQTLLIGIVGRLVPIKNHEMFLKAAHRLVLMHPDLSVKFLVVGDGELRSHLQRISIDLGLRDYVIFCGWMQNVSTVYADLNILALTSMNEGTPVSIIESMAASVPVIATQAGGVSDLLGFPMEKFNGRGFTVCERGILCQKNDDRGFHECPVKYRINSVGFGR